MNRLKKILNALRTLNRDPSHAIADAWSTVFEEARKCREGDRSFSDALDLLGSVVRAVTNITDDLSKKDNAS